MVSLRIRLTELSDPFFCSLGVMAPLMRLETAAGIGG